MFIQRFHNLPNCEKNFQCSEIVSLLKQITLNIQNKKILRKCKEQNLNTFNNVIYSSFQLR